MATHDTPGAPARRSDLDWLRVLAVLLLVPFHTAIIFSLNPRDMVYIKDTVESPFLVWTDSVIYQFHMPLLFLIAGASTWYALRKRTGNEYLKERVTRLLVPAIFGMLVLVPPMLYLQFLWNPALTGRYTSFWDYYPHYFQFTGDLSGFQGNWTPAHLWFILFLLGFSALALPLFRYLRGSGEPVVRRLAAFAQRPGVMFLFPVLLLLTRAITFPADKNPLYYILLFIAGFVLVGDARFQAIINHYTWGALGVAVAGALGVTLWMQPWGYSYPSFAWQSILTTLANCVLTWCWLIAILGLANRYLNRDSRLLRYLSEAAYPFYIMHLPIDTLVGFYVVRWDVGIGVKYVAIVVLTVALTLAVYEIGVRHTTVTRWLFGMKPLAKSPTPRVGVQPA